MNILLGNAKSDPEEGDGNSDGNRPTHLKDTFVLHDCPKVEGVEFLMEQLTPLAKGVEGFSTRMYETLWFTHRATVQSFPLHLANALTMTKSRLSLQIAKGLRPKWTSSHLLRTISLPPSVLAPTFCYPTLHKSTFYPAAMYPVGILVSSTRQVKENVLS